MIALVDGLTPVQRSAWMNQYRSWNRVFAQPASHIDSALVPLRRNHALSENLLVLGAIHLLRRSQKKLNGLGISSFVEFHAGHVNDLRFAVQAPNCLQMSGIAT